MSKSIAVFGAGPGLGQAVARRYAREGYAVTLVGRRQEPLDLLAKELTSAGAAAHVITADLSRTEATPRLAEQIRAEAGHLDAFYYAPTPDTGFVSAANLTPQHAQVAEKGVYVGMLYIGAAIKNSAFHAEMEKAKAAGNPVWEMPTVDPEHLAGLLWTMHDTKGQREVICP
jgi:NAD(P)-dependent dehydrogenase (short-subunit alcohol dehydrogenase family)